MQHFNTTPLGEIQPVLIKIGIQQNWGYNSVEECLLCMQEASGYIPEIFIV
ncbi:hypothetical protein H8356DRAFT_1330223 [Neocallimastix lanati (nom. inval.)]|nr:hypothetical protein H8356DRAFT_1330223 [Neocallimastix sp. JGI-2020a]